MEILIKESRSRMGQKYSADVQCRASSIEVRTFGAIWVYTYDFSSTCSRQQLATLSISATFTALERDYAARAGKWAVQAL
jgi:hypothetical protein